MLTKRIIPCLDVKDGRVVKGIQFKNLMEMGAPDALAMRYCSEGADEIVFYDISASYENRATLLEAVKNTAKNVTIPLTVGGGVNTLHDFYNLLNAGADKISVNSGALLNPQLISDAAKRFGSQCVVLSIDISKNINGQWMVFSKGGRIPTGLDAVEWAKKAVAMGAGEIVVNSIDNDGVVNGYDLEITAIISRATSVPVIASGGAGTLEHFTDAFKIGLADGALAASVFHKERLKISTVKMHLEKNGIPIRTMPCSERTPI